MDDEEKIRRYTEDGWCPLPVEHHPAPVREALHKIGLVPGMKECFANSQKLCVADRLDGLEYHEGWITSIIPIQHAWLVYEGEILDLTLGHKDGIEYHDSRTYGPEDIRKNMLQTQMWAPLTSNSEFMALCPVEMWRDL